MGTSRVKNNKSSEKLLEVLKTHPTVTVRFMLKDVMLAILGIVSSVLSVSIMTVLLVCALIQNYNLFSNWWRLDKFVINSLKLLRTLTKRADPSSETFVLDEKYYVERYGYCFERHEVVTEDGFILELHRVFKPMTSPPSSPSISSSSSSLIPVILQHGLFQSSGIFLSNEKDSLAFVLADGGYDVWLGNNRGVFPKHVSLKTSDAKYWDWTLDELGTYDFPAIVQYVCQQTKNQKVTYIGHSQGNAQAFLGLSRNPKIADKIRLFVAMAPAFYVSPPKHWALRLMIKMKRNSFYFFFGRRDFVPIMCYLQANVTPVIFSCLSFNVFCYLFNWSDALWDSARIPKYFLFTPRPTPCKLLTHWSDIIRVGTLHFYRKGEEDIKLCNVSDVRCPVAIFYSTGDTLVHGDGIINDMCQKKIDIFHVEKIDKYEHMDMIWAIEAKDTVFPKLVNVLNKALKNPQQES